MREIVSLNETIIAVLVFGIPLLVVPLMKFIFGYARLRKNSNDFLGLSSVGCFCSCCSDLLYVCCWKPCDELVLSHCYCGPQSCKSADIPGKNGQDVDKEDSKALRENNDEKKQASFEVSDRKIIAKEREVIVNKIPDVATVSLSYLSNMTLIPQERIKKILLDDSDYLIEEPFVINKKMLTEEQVIKVTNNIRSQIKSDEISPTYGICSECQSLYDKGSEFCPNCGVRLRDN